MEEKENDRSGICGRAYKAVDRSGSGIILLLLLIIKIKIHPVLSLLISALVIGLGAGMPVPTLVSTVEKGAGETLQGIVLLIGLGSLFGGILEVSGGAQCVAQTLVNKFGEKKAGIALGITGLVVGTTVFFEAGVVILIPLAFGLAKKTKKSTLYYVIPLLAGLATGFAFIPPSAGSVLVANMLNVDLGIMIAVGVPVGILSLLFAGILWSKFIGSKINVGIPVNVSEVREADEANEKWTAAGDCSFPDCGTDSCIGRSCSSCDDNGSRNHGSYAGSG